MENFLIKPKFYILHSTLYIHKSPRMRSLGLGSGALFTKTAGGAVQNAECKM